MLIAFFEQKQTTNERTWLLLSPDVSGEGTRDEPLRTFAWDATEVQLDQKKGC